MSGNIFKFEMGDTKFEAEYIGRYDFLYLYNMKLKRFPFVCTINGKSCAFINIELLSEQGFSLEEIKAILWHEVGHQISTKQEKLQGLDKEFDADNYAISKCSSQVLISALQKSIQMINNIGSEKGKKGIPDIQKRIEEIQKIIEKEEMEEEK